MNIEFFAARNNAPRCRMSDCRRWLAVIATAITITASTGYAETPLQNQHELLDSGLVGEVSLVLGKAYLESAGGRKKPIIPGTPIRASDRIHTESNGHVHIRFIDQALVSVRPDSRLEIVRYEFNPERPEQSSIKLNLEEGITRSISGKGARAARDRFRMNTPIAAIGVRGTDFVVSASQSAVRALVNEGAIVLAPYSADCTMDTFGPCAVNAIELTDSSLQIIELDGSSSSPRLIPAPHEREPGMMREDVRLAVSNAEDKRADEDAGPGSGVYQETVVLRRVNAEVAIATQPPPVAPGPPQSVVPKVPAPLPEPTPAPPAVIAPPDLTPPAPVIAEELTERQLVWGRWSGQGAQERITLEYAQAKGTTREVTVGNRDYALFRTENGSKKVQTGLGSVGFSLSSAQAFYHADSGIVAMTVNGGSLNINFESNTFATSLDLNHSSTGAVNFSAAGRVYSGGYFHTTSDTERMAGAVSLDGREAGYFFEKQLQTGTIQGLTLWDNQ